jgi:putative glutamine amidotransferase
MASQTRPFIGINTDFVPAGKHTAAHFRLHTGYADAILAAGGVPWLVPPMGKETDVEAYLNRLDGFILTGGALDIDPRRWGIPGHPAVQPMPDRRDDSDRVLVRHLLDHRLPILAIGLGVQQLNVACGGALHLHLPEDLPRCLPHRDPTGATHRHTVLVEPGTRMEEIYGSGEIRINSSHHQAIRLVGTGLRVAAIAPDGVIEGVEAVDPGWFCVGVQWHPESESASALDVQLFEYFVQACARHAQPISLVA